MAGGRLRIWVVLGVLSVAAAPAGVAGAQSPAQTQYETEEGALAKTSRIPVLEARVGEQDAALRDQIDEISAVGAQLEDAQAQVDGARGRAQELQDQTQSLQRQIDSQKNAYLDSKANYEEKARAAYEGDHLRGMVSLLGGLLGSAGGAAGVGGDHRVASILLDGRESLDAYEESGRILQNTTRQISQKRRAYEKAVTEESAKTEELRRREGALDQSIARMGASKARTEDRLQNLKAAERARILKSRAATGGGEESRGYELGIARKDIVARTVDPIPKKEYIKLYKKSAEKYGFGKDWYVLAAVGKIESNHGENMGPSDAGAMGPMQFLPSTWEASGVDGNGDGVANIMDPEDAIPAAAGYLRDGGAPRDWYRALYTYNHADWYVKKVLAVAEAYRRLAKDDRVGPYT